MKLHQYYKFISDKYMTFQIAHKASQLAKLRDRLEYKENTLQSIMTKYVNNEIAR